MTRGRPRPSCRSFSKQYSRKLPPSNSRTSRDIYENAEVLGVEVKTFSGGHVRFTSKAELQRYGGVFFVHYEWTSARRGQGYRRGHGSGARTPDSPVQP